MAESGDLLSVSMVPQMISMLPKANAPQSCAATSGRQQRDLEMLQTCAAIWPMCGATGLLLAEF